MKSFVAIFAGIALLAPAAAAAPGSSAPIDAVLNCRSETAEQARLACYDAAAASLSAAATGGELVVVDRDDVRKTRRSLFGFSVPKMPFFRGDTSEDEQPDEIEAKIKSARGTGYDKWLFELDSGARWQTTEPLNSNRDPRPGQAIKVKKGMMGSYFLSVEKGRSVKAIRVG